MVSELEFRDILDLGRNWIVDFNAGKTQLILFTIGPYIEYCCHVWAAAPSCYLELLEKLQKRIWRAVGPSLAASLKPVAHRQNVASLSLFYRYHFGRYSSELAQLVPIPFFRGGLLIILIDCMIFLSPFICY